MHPRCSLRCYSHRLRKYATSVCLRMQKVSTIHFLELNWKPLKTECVLHLVGCGTKRAWTTIERSAEQRATAEPGAAKHVCRTPGGIECNIVPCYKHVGSMIDGIGGLECELHPRIAAANRFYQPLAKKLMSAKFLNCKTKVHLFRALVLSVLLHGCETWPEPTQSQGRRLEAKCFCRLAGEPRVQIPGRETISDVDLRRQLEIPSIESQIRRARLRYAASLIEVAPPSVAVLLVWDGKYWQTGSACSSVTSNHYGMRAHCSETLVTQASIGNVGERSL